jgi:hypothetical protein
VMSVLPDNVSHGGTYAGNRVAAAAAVKTLEIIRDTDALETIHALGRRIQAASRGPQRDGLPYTSPATRRCSGSCSARRPERVPRLGQLRPRPVRRDRDRHGRPRRDARAGLARAVVPLRGPHEGDYADRIVSIFSDSLDAALEDRAHGKPAVQGLRRRVELGRRLARATGEEGQTMVLDGNAVRSVDRAAALLLALGDAQGEAGVTELARRPRAPQVDGLPAARRPSRSGAWSSRTRRPASTGWASS